MMRKFIFTLLACLTISTVMVAQTVTVTGTVTDEYGSELPGVNIVEKGTVNGTVTGLEGEYSIKVSPNAVLQFSFMGMDDMEAALNGRSSINVNMSTSSEMMEEVVITAFGITKEKKAVGFATDRITGDELVQTMAPNVISALSGKSAGVFVSNPNSISGGSSKIIIRGNTTIDGDNQPLIIVDGMPLNNDLSATSAMSNRDWGSAINYINPDDIATMDILKGPAATALYGSRGANGVIIITSKKGQTMKKGLGIDYSYTFMTENASRYQDMQDEYGMGGPASMLWHPATLSQNADGDYVYPNSWSDVHGSIPAVKPNGSNYNSWDLFSWYTPGSSWGPKLDGTEIKWWDGEMRSWDPQPDNYKAFYQTGITQIHNLGLSNVGKFGSIRVSLNHTDNKAVIANSGYDKNNVYIGAYLNFAHNFHAEISTVYNQFNRRNAPLTGGEHQGAFTELMYGISRDYKAFDWDEYENPDGSQINYGQMGWPYWYMNNIGWEYKVKERNQYRTQIRSNVKLIWDVLSWWKISGSAGVDFINDEYENKFRPIDVFGLKGGGYSHNIIRKYSPNLDILTTFHKNDLFADGFNASITAGGETWYRNNYGISGSTSKNFKDPFIYSFANYIEDPNVNRAIPKEYRYERKINSVFGFIDLSYRSFLYLNITGRNDWSSTLPIDNNSYFYPSVSLSFVPTEIYDIADWVSFLKYRIGYAMSGSDYVPYQVFPTFTPGSYAGSPTLAVNRTLPPAQLKPQRSKSFETGIQIAFFDNRLSADFTYYNTYSYDQIMNSPLTSSSGASGITFNSGEIQLTGFEFEVRGTIIKKKDLRWGIGFSGSRYSNKLISLTEGIDRFPVNGGEMWGSYGTGLYVSPGQNYGILYGWGIAEDPNGNKILDAYHDENGNVTGTLYRRTEEQIPVGNATPKMRGGINTDLFYKGFNLFALVDYKWGGDVYNAQYGSALIHGMSPTTLEERNGGGLPYTYPDGTTENIGVIMDGVVEVDPGVFQENTNVVHAYWKYSQNGWNMCPQPQAVMDNSWVVLRELSLSYSIPERIVKKSGFLINVDISVVGRNLFYFYSSLPDHINPEGINGVGNNQAMIFGALPTFRTIGFTLKFGI